MTLVLFLLALAALWSFDLHKILAVKLRARNAGDAAALAAARWQGITLNLIGELNLLQVAAWSEAVERGEADALAARALADLQARLCYVGPLIGFLAAQQAAKNNGLYVNPEATQTLQRHAAVVRAQYPIRFPIPPYVNDPPTSTAWDDYAMMLDALATLGVAAEADNARWYFDFTSTDHFLLNPAFYDAVATSDWCWFLHYAMDLLRAYRNWRDWPPLPLRREAEPMNSELFGLHLTKVRTPFLPPEDHDAILAMASQATGAAVTDAVFQAAADWFCYRESDWANWSERLPDGFPFVGRIKPQYDYVGADAAVRVEAIATRLTPAAGAKSITWTAAAKPFGHLDGPTPPHRYQLVLPAFHSVRLIPVDASTAPASGSRPGWTTHIREHLPAYAQGGNSALSPDCWYCLQLATWENSTFRQQGLNWLAEHRNDCHHPGPGPGYGGGTRRGH